jgi:hypothetical protein
MPRAFGQKFLLDLRAADSNRLGIRLARACVEANLPAAYVAKALEVSPTTIHAWFRGQGVRENRRLAVETFTDLLQRDIDSQRLPVNTLVEAKAYIYELTGVQI